MVLGIAVGIIVVAISIVFYLLSKDALSSDKPEDFLKMSSDSEPQETPDMKTLDSLVGGEIDISKIEGRTEKYTWTQNESEVRAIIVFISELQCQQVEMYVTIPPDVRAKNVKVDMKHSQLVIEVNGNKIINGEVYREILPDDCNWQLEGEGESRKIWLTLVKRNKTKGNQHWKTVIKGDAEIDVSRCGVPLHNVDPSMDKARIRQMMDEVRHCCRLSQLYRSDSFIG